MQTHVFAVWDFMSLLKRLQRDLTCTDIPWRPPASPSLARFVNEVVLAEESDIGPRGACSHLELYLDAMKEIGASSAVFERFLRDVATAPEPAAALAHPDIAPFIRRFVADTLSCAQHASTTEVMAVFLFGRETLLPEIYERLVPRCEVEGRPATALRFYLERHIDVDGDSHAPMAERALAELAGADEDAWAAAGAAARRALASRHALWDGALAHIETLPESSS